MKNLGITKACIINTWLAEMLLRNHLDFRILPAFSFLLLPNIQQKKVPQSLQRILYTDGKAPKNKAGFEISLSLYFVFSSNKIKAKLWTSWQNPSQRKDLSVLMIKGIIGMQAGQKNRKANPSIKTSQIPMCCKIQAYSKDLLDTEQKPVIWEA